MDKFKKYVWVTGASSGLGKSLSIVLAGQGHTVVVSARDHQKLDELSDQYPNIIPFPCDITDEKQMNEAGAGLAAISPVFDQVYLNAGNCEYMDFSDPDWGIPARVMDVNYFGSIRCLRAVWPLLESASGFRAHIVVIASQVTSAPFPRAEAYGASKAAVQYFFNSLRTDLAQGNIDISIVNPGFVDTPLTQKNNFKMPFLMDVDAAAKLIVNRMRFRPRTYDFPLRLKLMLSLSGWFPRLWQKLVSQSF
ncbi:MAG: short-subunit dehydrogenase [Gammaproteobacteria bacterium]|jgi:short-subunit dehydrogenase